MFRRNSWARGPREEHTRLDLGFWFLLFSEPFVNSAHTRIDNCVIQQIPARWGALKPLSEKWEHLSREQAWPGLGERKTGWEIREEACSQRGKSQKVRVWERVKAREGDKSSKSSLNTAVETLGFQSRRSSVVKCSPSTFFFFFFLTLTWHLLVA